MNGKCISINGILGMLLQNLGLPLACSETIENPPRHSDWTNASWVGAWPSIVSWSRRRSPVESACERFASKDERKSKYSHKCGAFGQIKSKFNIHYYLDQDVFHIFPICSSFARNLKVSGYFFWGGEHFWFLHCKSLQSQHNSIFKCFCFLRVYFVFFLYE